MPGPAIDLQVQSDGRILDVVSGTYATISRTGPKYGISPSTGLISSVGDNLLFPEAYSVDPTKLWATIEESRTNLLFTSAFDTDTNSDGYADGWGLLGGLSQATKSTTRVIDGGLYGDSTRLSFSSVVGGTGQTYGIYQRVNLGSALVATAPYTFSLWAKGSTVGATPQIEIYCRNSSGTGSLATVIVSLAATLSSTTWTRYSATVTAPIGTYYIDARAGMYAIDIGDTGDLELCCTQLEPGVGATSFIPTTPSEAATRNADIVTFPSTAMSADQGTIYAVSDNTAGVGSSSKYIFSWYQSANETIGLYLASGTNGYPYAVYRTGAISYYSATASSDNINTRVVSMPYVVGSPVNSWVTGVKGSSYNGTIPSAIASPPATISIGSRASTQFMNSHFHRFVYYEEKHSDHEAGMWAAAYLYGKSSAAPVVDLRPQTDGTLKDVVSGTNASVTRASAKYGIDPSTGTLSSVGNDLLYPEGYTGGAGRWMAVEEARTNYLLNSSFGTDSNADGTSDSWVVSAAGTTATLSRNTTNPIFGTVQKVRLARTTFAGNTYPAFYQASAAGTFAPAESTTVSIWYRNLAKVGTNPVYLYAKTYNSALSVLIDQVGTPLVVASDNVWRRASVSIPIASANTSRVLLGVQMTQVTNNTDYFEVELACAQIEKLQKATSFIPVDTERPSDDVRFSSASMSADCGTVLALTGDLTPSSVNRRVFSWYADINNFIRMYSRSADSMMYSGVRGGGGTSLSSTVSGSTGTAVRSLRWDFMLNKNFDVFVGGTKGTTTATAEKPAGLPSTFCIGGENNLYQMSSPLGRMVIFDFPLFDADVQRWTELLTYGTPIGSKRYYPSMATSGE